MWWMDRRILFLTGTRADFGKLKSLILELQAVHGMDVHLFVTGMHMLAKYGMTSIEVERAVDGSIYKYINQNSGDSMDYVLAKTIHGLSDYVKDLRPDLIIVHGDRVEAMAGAIVGSLNNILVGHVEGGEVSGTIDELMRHSISKMSHLHFVCNERAKRRLIQLGELEASVFVIGSPDLDAMTSSSLPSLEEATRKYEIPFKEYSMLVYHPVTTEMEHLASHIDEVIAAVLESGLNYIAIYPNNDHGTDIILDRLGRLKRCENVRLFPSIRFEYFLTLLKNARFIAGNSSAGVREAPFFGVPSINIGSRQNNRAMATSIVNVSARKDEVLTALRRTTGMKCIPAQEFGNGNSARLFVEIMMREEVWETCKQKQFNDMTTQWSGTDRNENGRTR